MLALLATGYGTAGEDELLTGLFAGPRAGLRPMYDRVESVIAGFGDDVEVLPEEDDGRLQAEPAVRLLHAGVGAAASTSGSRSRTPRPPTRASRRRPAGWRATSCPITSADQVDDDVVGWLRIAYDRG